MGQANLANAQAQDEYLVSRIGAMIIKKDNAKPLLAAGLYYGYGIDKNIAIEAETNIGLSGGAFNQGDDVVGNYNLRTIAGYGVYRLALSHQGYIKAKFGLLFENIIRQLKTTKESTLDYGFSGGLGIGLNFKKRLTIETEISIIEKTIFHPSMGIHYIF